MNLEERKRIIKQNQKLQQETSLKHDEDEYKIMYESLDKISIGSPHRENAIYKHDLLL